MEQNEKKSFRCMGDCLNCRAMNDRKIQWQYCAAQHAYNSMMLIKSMQDALDAMAGTIGELNAKIEAIQNNEVEVFATDEIVEAEPQPTENDIAQEGDGVKK